jgi:hypothetical protein
MAALHIYGLSTLLAWMDIVNSSFLCIRIANRSGLEAEGSRPRVTLQELEKTSSW